MKPIPEVIMFDPHNKFKVLWGDDDDCQMNMTDMTITLCRKGSRITQWAMLLNFVMEYSSHGATIKGMNDMLHTGKLDTEAIAAQASVNVFYALGFSGILEGISPQEIESEYYKRLDLHKSKN